MSLPYIKYVFDNKKVTLFVSIVFPLLIISFSNERWSVVKMNTDCLLSDLLLDRPFVTSSIWFISLWSCVTLRWDWWLLWFLNGKTYSYSTRSHSRSVIGHFKCLYELFKVSLKELTNELKYDGDEKYKIKITKHEYIMK